MKKLLGIFVMMLVLTFTVNGFSECSQYVPAPTVETAECPALFVLDINHELVGIKSLEETNKKLPFNCFDSAYIRGILDDGTILRGTGMALLQQVDNYWFGFTPFDVSIKIISGYDSLVQSIIMTRLETNTVNNSSIIASTLWFDGEYAGHIFYTTETAHMVVARLTFLKQNISVNIWAGDIDGDNQLELGFRPGVYINNTQTNIPTSEETPCPNPESTPTPTSNNSENSTSVVNGCGVTVNNTGNYNNITVNQNKINGDNNSIVNNTNNNITLFGISINNNNNTTITTINTGIQINKPTLIKDSIRMGSCG